MLAADIILTHKQIKHKITRMAWQVYENNMDEKSIWIVGIDQRGMFLAEQLATELKQITSQEIHTFNVLIDRQTMNPTYDISPSEEELINGVVVLVDDVLNSGKSMVTAMLPLLSSKVRKIQVLVLAARSHRLFPVKADFVGIKMATTLQEHLNFDNSEETDLKLTLS